MRSNHSGINRSPKRQSLNSHLSYLIVGLISLVILGACTRTTIPIDSTPTVPPEPTEAPQEELPPTDEPVYNTAGTYAVVWTPESETLKLRVPAGIAGSVVDELAFDAQGVRVTGNATSLGSSLWVEILGPDGEMGWVNSWNLTEDVPGDVFCGDSSILTLLEGISQALLDDDIERLMSQINPKRGLILRHDWWNPEVRIRPSEIENLYLSRESRNWGTLSGGDFPIEGTYQEVFVPLLKDVLGQTPTAVCKEIPSGVTSRPVVWPGEYENLHFYAFHRESPEGGNRFDWRTLVFAFEYIQGVPYLTLMVHYHGDI